MPVDKIQLEEAHKFLEHMRPKLQQLDLGARRRTAEWNYTLDQGDILGVLVGDAQNMRRYTPMLVLQIRVALAEGKFDEAVHHLETGFAMSRHATEGPFLVNGLIGVALATQFVNTVADFVERPAAPNLYWALVSLPRPLVDLRREVELEYRILERIFPDLGDLDRERTSEQWDGVLRRIRTTIQRDAELARETKEVYSVLKAATPSDPAANSPDLIAARSYVTRTRHLSPEQAEAMPAAEALILYMNGVYQEERDFLYRASYLPYAQSLPLLDAATQRLARKPTNEGEALARLLLPALPRVMSRLTLLQRSVAGLTVVEALRVYAAAHDGKLPEKLDDVTEVPVPLDPATGKAFEYSHNQDTATLVAANNAPVPDRNGHATMNGLRYRVTIRK
jgi:hypothetical protein